MLAQDEQQLNVNDSSCAQVGVVNRQSSVINHSYVRNELETASHLTYGQHVILSERESYRVDNGTV